MMSVTRMIRVYPSAAEGMTALGDGCRLSELINRLQDVLRVAPREPGSGFETATVYGIAGLTVQAVETLSPEQVRQYHYERVLAALKAASSEPDGLKPEKIRELLTQLDRTEL